MTFYHQMTSDLNRLKWQLMAIISSKLVGINRRQGRLSLKAGVGGAIQPTALCQTAKQSSLG